MSPVDARTLGFAADAERDWGQVEANLAKALAHDPSAGGPECAWVALALDHAYEAFETMLVRVERALALPERHGPSWHRAVLEEACRPIAGLRPALVPTARLDDWTALLGFRHFLRHAYAAELEAPRLLALRARLERATAATAPCVAAALAALRAS